MCVLRFFICFSKLVSIHDCRAHNKSLILYIAYFVYFAAHYY